MKKFILICMTLLSIFCFAKNNEEYFKARVVEITTKEANISLAENEQISRIDNYRLRISEGTNKGEIIDVDFPIYRSKQYNIDVRLGDRVIVYKSVDTENGVSKTNYYISDVDKRVNIYLTLFIFVFLALIVSKFKGIKALIALASSVLFIFYIFIPAISHGGSPIIYAIITSIFSSLITIYLITGISKKSLVALLGTVVGVSFSGLLSLYFTNAMRLTGYVNPELLAYGDLFKNINLRELISAGIIIGSLGAILDITMSISSAINEIYTCNNNISAKSIYKSAMKIGNDIIGTMMNTLILAYIGSTLMSTLIIYIQRSEFSLGRIINYEEITVELLRSICGSIGIIIAVPITSIIGAYIFTLRLGRKSSN